MQDPFIDHASLSPPRSQVLAQKSVGGRKGLNAMSRYNFGTHSQVHVDAFFEWRREVDEFEAEFGSVL